MPVRRIELSSIEAKRYTKPHEKVGQIRIDHNSTVSLVTSISDEEADVEFRYTASYGSVGVIRLEGTLRYSGNAKELYEHWSKTSQVPGNLASEIHTAVMRISVPEAVGIAKNLNLPPPIPLPQVKVGQKQAASKSNAPQGPEFA